MKSKDLIMELKELIYRTRNVIEKRYDKTRIATKTFNYKDIVELVKNPNFDIAVDIPHMLGCLLDLNTEVLENKVTDEELSDLIINIHNNQVIKNILDKTLCLKYDTIHTELDNEQLAQGVLHFFEQTGDPAHACMYIAPLQKDLREMITLLGLEERDYEQMWEEIISPKLTNGDYYTNVTIIIFELLRKKKMMMNITEWI